MSTLAIGLIMVIVNIAVHFLTNDGISWATVIGVSAGSVLVGFGLREGL